MSQLSNFQLEDLDASMNGKMTIKRPDVELRAQINNEAFEMVETDDHSQIRYILLSLYSK